MNDVFCVMDNDDDSFHENSLIISTDVLIQPWSSLRKTIELMLPSNISAKIRKVRNRTFEKDTEFEDEDNRPQYAISIPHGFQLSESIDHPYANACITSMLPMPGLRYQYATLDSNYVHVWNETQHTMKLPVKKPRNNEKESAVTSISRWEFVAKWRIIIISTSLLELKTLTADFQVTSTNSSIKPVLQ